MIKLISFISLFFLSFSAYAMDHDNPDYGFEGYQQGYQRIDSSGDRSHGKRFRLKKGESKKVRKHRPKNYFQQLRRKVNRLDPASRDAALKEIDRHIQTMSKIVDGNKGFKEYSGVRNKKSRTVDSKAATASSAKMEVKGDKAQQQKQGKVTESSSDSNNKKREVKKEEKEVEQQKGGDQGNKQNSFQKIRKRVKLV